MNPKIYKQYDSRWGLLAYPGSGSNLSNSGCGCLAVLHCAIELDKYKNLTPQECRKYMVQFATVADGTLWNGITQGLEHYGYNVHWREADSMTDIFAQLKSSLKRGVILFAKKSGASIGPDGTVWTTIGHYIAFTDYKIENGKHWFYMKDSGARDHDGWYCFEKSMKGCIRNLWICKSADSKPAPTPTPTPTPTPAPSGKLKVDGVGGTATVKALQKFLGTTQDGVLSGQNKNLGRYYSAFTAVSYGSGGSSCIKKLQSWLGLSNPDGIIGTNTTKALQKKLRDLGYLAASESIDGYFGTKSMKALQEFLNNAGKKKGGSPTPTPIKKETLVVDVSTFQSDIDWKKVKADGVTGAIIRCGFRGYESGKLQEDNMFQKHINGAYRAGLKVGVYFFTEAINAKEGKEEADYALKLIDRVDLPLSYPIAIDTEAQSAKNERAKNLSKAKRTEAIKGFCEQIKARGYEPMIYASTSWLADKLDMSKLPYKVWCAQYYKECQYKGKYVMWQYTSTGKINGIKGNVDLNKCYLESSSTKTYSGSFPTLSEIKTASNNGIHWRICQWAKKIAESGEYSYKVFTDDVKTHQCPVCHKLTGKYKGFNCICYGTASWKHGGGIGCNCSCEVINNATGTKLLKVSESEALSIAQQKIGVKNIKIIKNGGKAIPAKSLRAGDLILFYDGATYIHMGLYVGDGKYADSTSNRHPNIKYGCDYAKSGMSCKLAIRYTGSYEYLQYGDNGTAVKKVKAFLKWFNPNLKLADDGGFGDGTKKAVMEFQKSQKLTADGKVTQKLIDAMKKVQKK